MSQPLAGQTNERRREQGRLPLGIAARVETLEGQQPVRLIDLSQKGAHVILSQVGEVRRGVLAWLEFEAFGFVAWSSGDHVGFEFDEDVPLEQIIETRNRAPSVVREESLSIEQAARDWVEGKLNQGSER
jgi:hypothetical protein